MSRLTDPADELIQSTRGYVDAQLDKVRLDAVKGFSSGTSALAVILLILFVAGALLSAFSFAGILFLGELMGSYALAALSVAGALLLILLLLVLLREKLLRGCFVSLFAKLFFSDKDGEKLTGWNKLEKASTQTQARIDAGSADVSKAYDRVRTFYTPDNLLKEGLYELTPYLISLIFRRKK